MGAYEANPLSALLIYGYELRRISVYVLLH